jgi:clan AA aspartic protease (TIGR02281 family)
MPWRGRSTHRRTWPCCSGIKAGALRRMPPSAHAAATHTYRGETMLRLCCMGLGVLLAGQAWAGACHLEDYGSLPVEMVGARATTMVKINGTPTRFIIDTGAFFNIMSSANASSLGLKLEAAPFGYRINGIGGSASIQQAHVKEFGILDTTLKNVDFIVGGTDAGEGLLGANLLDIADLEIDLAHGKLTLFKADHCDHTLMAYWVKDGKYNVADIEPSDNKYDRRTFVSATINGRKVRALLDSGATATVLTRDAAERVGINLHGPDAKKGGGSFGFGSKTVGTWTVKVDTFSVGTETIQHSQMQVIDGRMGDNTEMLLGVDFLLAHHMFIGNSEKKVYFTYNGGRVFTFAEAPEDGDNSGSDKGNADKADASSADAGKSDAGKTDAGKTEAGKAGGQSSAASMSAGDYALSGQAHLSRGEASAALSDLDAAIRLAPDHAEYYVARAKAHAASKQGDAEHADLDKALSLDPKNADALIMRAHLRLSDKDRTGAAADVAAASAVVPAGSERARYLASLYIAMDQPAEALPLLDEWIRLHDNDAMLGAVLNERCWARGLSNQMLDDALKDCHKAIRRDGASAAYLDSLGLVELRLAHYPESIKAYEQAVAQNPRSGWARYGLGMAKIRSGQADAGNADLAAARVLDPKVEVRANRYGLNAAPSAIHP